MPKAILFDLDGTLLNIDMEVFLQYYFAEMISALQAYECVDAKKIAQQVYLSTEVMLNDRSPEVLNEEAFMNDFLVKCGHPESDARGFFDHFYLECFPALKIHCQPFLGILEMMESLFAHGFKVVIATNPVFPREAIQQRLEWAGIGGFPYALVTSYEEMHFCKPHVEYYAEICRRIGVEPQQSWMVGNDMGEDLPAGQIGMKTLLVEDMLIDKGQNNLKPDWRGSINAMTEIMKNLRPS